MPGGTILWDADPRTHRVTFVNATAAAVLGYPVQQWLADPGFRARHTHPDDRSRVDAWYTAHLAIPGDHEITYRMIAADGRVLWTHDTIGVVAGSSGVARIRGALRDISAQSRAAAEPDAAERYRSFIEHSAELNLEAAADGRLSYLSPSVGDLLGYRPIELLGADATQFLHPEDRPVALRRVRSALRRGGGARGRSRARAHDGRWRWFDWTANPSRRRNGETRVVVSARDVTEQREIEQERGRLRAQVEHAQRMDSVGQLADGVAHDFNNLLMVMLGNLDLASIDAPAATQAAIDEAVAAAKTASALARQLLAIARATASPREPLLLRPIVSGVMSMLRRTMGPQIALSEDLPADLVVVGNATQLRQVLLNLALNARDAIPDGGRLSVRARSIRTPPAATALAPRAAGYVLIEVEDSGHGMDAETAHRMFDPFFSTKGKRGSGLGASVVYGIAREHEGLVTVDSTPGHGATVRVYLPAATSAVGPRPRDARATGEPWAGARPRRRRPRRGARGAPEDPEPSRLQNPRRGERHGSAGDPAERKRRDRPGDSGLRDAEPLGARDLRCPARGGRPDQGGVRERAYDRAPGRPGPGSGLGLPAEAAR